MKHAVMTERAGSAKCAEADLTKEKTVFLEESEYTQEELESFQAQEHRWILRCRGTKYFLADSDSGEDAEGHYCGYFDLITQKAVFDQGRLVGVYLCNDGIRYSGRGRYNFTLEDMGFPGSDPFDFIPIGAKTHVFLFDDPATHRWKNWTLLERDPAAEYRSYLDF